MTLQRTGSVLGVLLLLAFCIHRWGSAGRSAGDSRTSALAPEAAPVGPGDEEPVAPTTLALARRAAPGVAVPGMVASAPARLQTPRASQESAVVPAPDVAPDPPMTGPSGKLRVRVVASGDLPRGRVYLRLTAADTTVRERSAELGKSTTFHDFPAGLATLSVHSARTTAALRVVDGLTVPVDAWCKDPRLDPLELDGLFERCFLGVELAGEPSLPHERVQLMDAERPLDELPGPVWMAERVHGGFELLLPWSAPPTLIVEAQGYAPSEPFVLRPGLVVRLTPNRVLTCRVNAALDPKRYYAVELESLAKPGWNRSRSTNVFGELNDARFDDVPPGAARARLNEHDVGAMDIGPLLRSGPWVDCVVPAPPADLLVLELEL